MARAERRLDKQRRTKPGDHALVLSASDTRLLRLISVSIRYGIRNADSWSEFDISDKHLIVLTATS